MLDKFKEHLDKSNFSKNTVDSYYFAVNQFFQQYDEVNKKNLKEYKIWMIENYNLNIPVPDTLRNSPEQNIIISKIALS